MIWNVWAFSWFWFFNSVSLSLALWLSVSISLLILSYCTGYCTVLKNSKLHCNRGNGSEVKARRTVPHLRYVLTWVYGNSHENGAFFGSRFSSEHIWDKGIFFGWIWEWGYLFGDSFQGLIQKIGAGGAIEIRGQFPCAQRLVRFTFDGNI